MWFTCGPDNIDNTQSKIRNFSWFKKEKKEQRMNEENSGFWGRITKMEKKSDYKLENIKCYVRGIFKTNLQKENKGKQSYEGESKKIQVPVGI